MPAKRPIIGCTTYQKQVLQARPIDIYGLMPSYIEAVRAAGGVPVMIPLGLDEEELLALFERIDGLLLPGGGDIDPNAYRGQPNIQMWGIDPERDRTEFFLAKTAALKDKPLLAICRGIQVFNVALGGTLIEDIPSLVGRRLVHDIEDGMPRNKLMHKVLIDPASNLFLHLEKTESWVNSIHHQSIRDLADGLAATAWAEDGVIEAAEIPDHPFAIGVQWHPENLIHDDPAMLQLFERFVAAAQAERVN